MSIRDRLPVFPSRASQLQMKARLMNAQKGHGLLRKKSDALQLKYRQILKKSKEMKEQSAEAMKKAMFSLAEAKFTGVDFGQLIFQDVDKAKSKVKVREENVAGVYLCILELFSRSSDMSLIGLGRGGQQISNVRQQFFNTLHIFVNMASIQSAIGTLSNSIKQLNRRINSIQYVIIPCIVRTLEYISTEMDEFEREEFYRLKKIQNSKRHSWLYRSKEQNMKKTTPPIASNTSKSRGGAGGDDIFHHDEDIIF